MDDVWKWELVSWSWHGQPTKLLFFWLFHGVILSIKETKKARCFCWMSIGAMETMENRWAIFMILCIELILDDSPPTLADQEVESFHEIFQENWDRMGNCL